MKYRCQRGDDWYDFLSVFDARMPLQIGQQKFDVYRKLNTHRWVDAQSLWRWKLRPAKFVQSIYITFDDIYLPIVARIVSTFPTNAFVYASRRLYLRAICTRRRVKTMSVTVRPGLRHVSVCTQPSIFGFLFPRKCANTEPSTVAKRRDDAKFPRDILPSVHKENPTTITSQGVY